MDKGKLIPLVTAGILLLVALIIVFNNQAKSISFDKLIVNYKSQKTEYDTLNVDDVIVVDKVSFWVVSTVQNAVVMNASEYLLVDGKEVIEIELKLDETKTVCLTKDNCITFQLT